MPMYETIKPLLNICLDSVTQNMDSLWCKHYVDHYREKKLFYKYVLGPFEGIRRFTSFLLDDLNDE